MPFVKIGLGGQKINARGVDPTIDPHSISIGIRGTITLPIFYFKTYFSGYPKIGVYFDKENNLIGLESSATGYSISDSSGKGIRANFNCVEFKKMGIHGKFRSDWSEDKHLLIIDLNNPYKKS